MQPSEGYVAGSIPAGRTSCGTQRAVSACQVFSRERGLAEQREQSFGFDRRPCGVRHQTDVLCGYTR